jgi:SAM-dependent methyltransferase
MFTSLGYFDDEGENAALFSEMARCLKPGGGFVIDTASPQAVLETLSNPATAQTTHKLSAGTLIEKRSLAGNRVDKHIQWQTPDGCHEYHESVRLYEAHELSVFCNKAGLTVSRILPGIPPAKDRLLLVGRALGAT